MAERRACRVGLRWLAGPIALSVVLGWQAPVRAQPSTQTTLLRLQGIWDAEVGEHAPAARLHVQVADRWYRFQVEQGTVLMGNRSAPEILGELEQTLPGLLLAGPSDLLKPLADARGRTVTIDGYHRRGSRTLSVSHVELGEPPK